MSCKFLTRLPQNNVNAYIRSILISNGNQRPITSRNLKTVSDKSSRKTTHRCPFLNEIPSAVKEVKDDDAIKVFPRGESFAYNEFFHQQLVKKKLDHTYRIFKKIDKLGGLGHSKAIEKTSGDKLVTVWCSNDYLGMSSHPEVKIAVRKALDSHGAGAGGTRNISGNSKLHEDLEDALSKLHQKEAALIFTSCFVANDSTLYTLGKILPDCHIFSDEGNHASLIYGIRNSGASKHIYRHNDPAHLEELLKSVNERLPKIVAFESVHSMSGDICNLGRLCDIAHKYNAMTFVDEVHAVGVYGWHGGGVGERDEVLHKMDVISGTLGKAYGTIGGYIASNSIIIDLVRSYAPGFIFTTSLPPPVVAGAAKAIEILASDEGRVLRKHLHRNVGYLKELLVTNSLPIRRSPSHIIPILVGDPVRCSDICNALLREKGHYVQAINYPTVAKGQERLRLAPTPYHDKLMMEQFVRDLKEVWSRVDGNIRSSAGEN